MTLKMLWKRLMINAERNFSDFVPSRFANGTDTVKESVSWIARLRDHNWERTSLLSDCPYLFGGVSVKARRLC